MQGVRRRFARVWLVTAVVTAAGLVWAAAHGDSYTATARIVVAAAEDAAHAPDPARLARTEAELLRDPALVRGVVPRASPGQAQSSSRLARCRRALGAGAATLAAWFGASPSVSDAALAARAVRALQVHQAGDTDVLTVSFTWSDPAAATEALGAVLARYAKATSAGSEARDAARRLAARLSDAQDELAAIDSRLAGRTDANSQDNAPGNAATIDSRLAGRTDATALGNTPGDAAGINAPLAGRADAIALSNAPGEPAGIGAPLAGHTGAAALAGERTRLEARLDDQRAALGRARLERDLAQRKIDGVDHAYRSGGWVDTADAADATGGPAPLASGFAALLDKRSALLAAGRADSAEMRALDRETARAREQTYALVRQVLTGRLAALDETLSARGAAITDGQAALRALDRHVSEAEMLETERSTAAARVAEAARALDTARLRARAAWVGAGDTPAIGEVTPPAGPDWPSSAAVVGTAALLGLAAGVASAAWAEARRRVIERRVDVSRHLGLEVLASLENVQLARLS